jgi:hypothetical protein
MGKEARQMAIPTDFIVSNQGTVWQFTPNTKAAFDFIDEFVPLESWQWLGRTFAVDWRLAEDLVYGIVDHGLRVEIR